jgi:hypothetical protein
MNGMLGSTVQDYFTDTDQAGGRHDGDDEAAVLVKLFPK